MAIMEGGFEKVKEKIIGVIYLNTSTKNKHVGGG